MNIGICNILYIIIKEFEPFDFFNSIHTMLILIVAIKPDLV